MINSIDEAIAHAREVAEEMKHIANKFDENDAWENNEKCACLKCAKEHEQLAEWLEELKDYREGKRTCENCKHQNKAENQYPCSICRCNHPNKFEWAKESEGD